MFQAILLEGGSVVETSRIISPNIFFVISGTEKGANCTGLKSGRVEDNAKSRQQHDTWLLNDKFSWITLDSSQQFQVGSMDNINYT
jgi:hypothetical protein